MDKAVKRKVILDAFAVMVILQGIKLGLEALISPALPDTPFA